VVSNARPSDAAGLPRRKSGVLKEFWFRFILSPCLRFFTGAALLEYPREYLDFLREKTLDHHCEKWGALYRRN
jgi:hypothetical protein